MEFVKVSPSFHHFLFLAFLLLLFMFAPFFVHNVDRRCTRRVNLTICSSAHCFLGSTYSHRIRHSSVKDLVQK